jgi:predicted nucleic acid-binding protein
MPSDARFHSLRLGGAAIEQRHAMSIRSWRPSGLVIAIVDSGPLYAAVDADDDEHTRCLSVFERMDLHLVIPAMVVAEVTYLVGRRLGPEVESRFLRGLSGFEVEAPDADDWDAIANLVERYRDFPLGGTDASVVTLAERLGTDLLITLDRRHFAAVRRDDGSSFHLLP